jgi:hypothetical protein
MAEDKESYWSKHHWTIIQCVLGLYCATFATWEHSHPRSTSTISAPNISPPSAGAAVNHASVMPFWLWLGIIAFILSFFIPRAIAFFRKKARPVFDAEVYRIVRAPKGAFVDQTHDFYKGAGKGDDFKVDIDILVELYVVNMSSETQYIRDVSGFLEVEGETWPLVMQKGFEAFELNDRKVEWCLDPTPKDAPISFYDRELKLETLPQLADTFPITLEPRKAVEGWVKLLISKINPDKLEGVTDYNLKIRDSLGVKYPLIKAVQRSHKGEIGTRNTA